MDAPTDPEALPIGVHARLDARARRTDTITCDEPRIARTGLILAGGRARRFGGEKALATLDGTPLVRHVAEAIAPAVDELLINCRPDQRDAFAAALDGVDHGFALDRDPDRGPVAGLDRGLDVARGRYAFVAGCDQPFLSPALVERLFVRARGTAGAVPEVDGRVEPLGAVYRTEDAVGACERTIDAGSGRLLDVIDHLDPVSTTGRSEALADIDTRAALREARSACEATRDDFAVTIEDGERGIS